MIATILICILSTLAFCLGARGILAVAGQPRHILAPWRNRGFSARAWRIARGYLTFTLGVLTLVALIGAVSSFIELFRLL